MRLAFSIQIDGQLRDVTADVAGKATVADLVTAIAHETGESPVSRTLTVWTPTATVEVPQGQLISDTYLPRGAVLELGHGTEPSPHMGSLGIVVRNGPQAGERFVLKVGSNTLGRSRSADVSLSDPAASRWHARILVGKQVEIVDNNSANGMRIDGQVHAREVLYEHQSLTIGDTELGLDVANYPRNGSDVLSTREAVIRSPRLRPAFVPEILLGPELPKRPVPSHFPMTMLVAPVFMGIALYAITERLASLLFVGLMPMMMMGMWFENRRSMRRHSREAWQRFESEMVQLDRRVGLQQDRERLVMAAWFPGVRQVITSVEARSSLLWSRRPDLPGFGTCRLGIGTVPSAVAITPDSKSGAEPKAWNRVREQISGWRDLPDSPVPVSLPESGGVAIVGRNGVRAELAAGVILQLAGLHAPSELCIVGCFGRPECDQWDWLKWLPHVRADGLTPSEVRLAVGPLAQSTLLQELAAIIDARSRQKQVKTVPLILVVVAFQVNAYLPQLVSIAETGPHVGVHLLWVTSDLRQVPAAVRTFLAVCSEGFARIGQVGQPESIQPVVVDPVPLIEATDAARALAPLVDLGAWDANQQEAALPDASHYLDLVEHNMMHDASLVVGRWHETGSISAEASVTTRPSTLRALLGVAAGGPLVVDLINQGPHALVGGTTGSGKSELLQTWVLALANDYSPDRLSFLLVDYKGGAAFADCVKLPHTVGLVTDLTPALVGRSLSSLNAEIKHREALLGAVGAKDLQTMEQAAPASAVPRLVVVVDEFAALVTDVPEFVDGILDIAQRGRSLGIHLILATQRPSGVIKENLRANTNIRIALRMADVADATDVVKDPRPADFELHQPGRAVFKCGSAMATVFQAAYLGGQHDQVAEQAPVVLSDFELASEQRSVAPPEVLTDSSLGTDLSRLVQCIQVAAESEKIAAPRRPWLPPLTTRLSMEHLVDARTVDFLPLGVSDRPEEQTQPILGFRPDYSGNLAVYGTTGSGKSSLLTTITIMAGLTAHLDMSHVYVLDCASGNLRMMAAWRHVGAVITAGETERIGRLMGFLRETVAKRSVLFSGVGAGSLPEYRRLSGDPHFPRILVLLDGLAAFRRTYDGAREPNPLEIFIEIASMARTLGVNIIWTAERAGAVPAALSAVTAERIILRLASQDEAILLRVLEPNEGDLEPPGRGVHEGRLLQLGSWFVPPANLSEWDGPAPVAIETLPAVVLPADLPRSIDGQPAIGLSGDSLRPVGLQMSGIHVLAGAAQSERRTLLSGVITCALRARPGLKLCLLGAAGSELLHEGPWHHVLEGVDTIAAGADDLQKRLEDAGAQKWLVIVEDAASLVNTPADQPVQYLLRSIAWRSHTLIAEGDTTGLQTSWPLLVLLRAAKRGLLLQPDQMDGDTLFRTPLPRFSRRDFGLGRGFLLQSGHAEIVQFVEVSAGGSLAPAGWVI
jgi:S-DNA-T family DNA segregation ATPase FtsK/SpoIIIE